MLGEAGRDASEAFEDVGHSDEARGLLDKYFVGNGPEVSSPLSLKAVAFTSLEVLHGAARTSELYRAVAGASCTRVALGTAESAGRFPLAPRRGLGDCLHLHLKHGQIADIDSRLPLQASAKPDTKRARGAGVEHGQKQCVALLLASLRRAFPRVSS